MFSEWLEKNDINKISFDKPIIHTADDRKYWDKFYDKSYIEKGKELIGGDWPIIPATSFMAFLRNNNRECMEKLSFARRNNLITLTLAELFENKDSFVDDIINGLFAICEESFWGLSAHYPREAKLLPDVSDPYIDLFASETAATLSVIIYLFKTKLTTICPEIVKRVNYELTRRIINSFFNHDDYHWMGIQGNHVNNWNPWIISNVITVFLLCCDNETKQKGIKRSLSIIDNYIVGCASDGSCDEGAGYWNVSTGAVFDFIDQLYIASNGVFDFYQNDYIKKSGKFIQQIYVGNRHFINYSDSDNINFVSNSIVYRYGKRINDNALAAVAGDFNCFNKFCVRMLRREIMGFEIDKEKKNISFEKSVKFDDLQLTVTRSENLTLSVIGAKNNLSHNHNDVGNISLFYKKEPILIDIGVGVYTLKTFSNERYDIESMQSSWHNLPEINGVMEHDGDEHKASIFLYDGNKTTVEFASAYEGKAGIKSLVRTAELIDINSLKICDKYEFENDKNIIVENLIFKAKPIINNHSVFVDGFIISVQSGTENIELKIDELHIKEDERLFYSWQKNSLFRLRFIFNNVGKSESITILVKKNKIA